jgi:lactate dehydrogenase-like 2-hydroxyacid dehydrogenase
LPKPPVLVLGTGPDWYLARFAEAFTLHHAPDGDVGKLPAESRNLRAMIAMRPVDAATIAALPRLEMIANAGAGYERLDIEAARARGIAVTNTPHVTDGCVADMAFALLLAVGRHIVLGDRYVRSGAWERGGYPLVPRVHGRRMGILGLGPIGLAIARRAEAFDMAVAYHNRRQREDVSFPWHPSVQALCAWADIRVVAAPGGDGTRHRGERAALDALGPRGILVNIARGSLVDEAALIAALQEGRLGGAGLDVFEGEPHVPEALRALDNVVLMPHRGGGTLETWADVTDSVKESLDAFFAGRQLPHLVG